MIISFKEHKDMRDYEQLDEKLIMYSNGAKYGQAVFLAGGAGSGKGFAQSQFMEVDKFKVFDVDELKRLFIKVRNLDVDLRKPEDVARLHDTIKKAGVQDARMNVLAKSLSASAGKGTLPNLLFDITLKDMENVKNILPMLNGLGYDSKNIHLTWVLTDYYVAVKANQERERVVPDKILLQTHVGAAETMSEVIKGNLPRGINGEVRVVLNNRDQTILFKDAEGKAIKTASGKVVIKDFTYVTLKKRGKRFEKDASVEKQVWNWISKNVPKDALAIIKKPET